jgi:hypothetical protein
VDLPGYSNIDEDIVMRSVEEQIMEADWKCGLVGTTSCRPRDLTNENRLHLFTFHQRSMVVVTLNRKHTT